MISNNYYNKVYIQITTYKQYSKLKEDMNHEKEIIKRFSQPDDNTKFICSICLNTKSKYDDYGKPECNKRKTKSCPICQKGVHYRWEGLAEKLKPEKCEVKEKAIRMSDHTSSTKTVQTSQTDVTQGLNLLNEVLTVFQSKKQICVEKEKYNKTVIVKDACVETESWRIKTDIKPKLTISKVYHISIAESNVAENNKFTIVNCSQPQRDRNSQYSIDLIKHKSSSIPQMKLEELKHSLKEKTKSKDAIEEVNRMFATVRKNALLESTDDGNRPLIRSGPRVLPVVRVNKKHGHDMTCGSKLRFSYDRREEKRVEEKHCKCCQTNNYLLSSGDSLIKPSCHCQQRTCEKVCGKGGHVSHCHTGCRQYHDVCDHCCQRFKDNRCHHHVCYEDTNDGDSCASS